MRNTLRSTLNAFPFIAGHITQLLIHRDPHSSPHQAPHRPPWPCSPPLGAHLRPGSASGSRLPAVSRAPSLRTLRVPCSCLPCPASLPQSLLSSGLPGQGSGQSRLCEAGHGAHVAFGAWQPRQLPWTVCRLCRGPVPVRRWARPLKGPRASTPPAPRPWPAPRPQEQGPRAHSSGRHGWPGLPPGGSSDSC